MTDQLIAELDAYEGHAYAVTFSPDGSRLLVGGFGGLIRVYDTTSWQEVAQYVHHDKSTNHIAFAPDGQTFAVSSSDRTITIWKSNTDEPTAILNGHRNTVMGLSWSPDGKRLVSGATDNTIRIWNLDDVDEQTRNSKVALPHCFPRGFHKRWRANPLSRWRRRCPCMGRGIR